MDIKISNRKAYIIEILGIVIYITFIFMAIISPTMAIGIPTMPMSIASDMQLLIVGFLAPIAEEIIFRGLLLAAFARTFGYMTGNIIVSILFAITHLTAYGIGMTSAFIGAGLFAIIAGIVAISTKNILPAIIMHSMANIWTWINRTGAQYVFV